MAARFPELCNIRINAVIVPLGPITLPLIMSLHRPLLAVINRLLLSALAWLDVTSRQELSSERGQLQLFIQLKVPLQVRGTRR